MKLYKYRIAVVLLGLSLIGVYACDVLPPHPTSEEDKNNPPKATMANVPTQGDTLFANVTLHWDGGDTDGFVEYYEYKYTTVDPNNPSDTLTVTEWDSTDKTSLTITFSSPLKLNKQIFRVRAVDNDQSISADTSKFFYTRQTIPPQVTLATPEDGSQNFFLNKVTDWFRGIQITYEGEDEDGTIEAFGWKVEGQNSFTWTQDTSAMIPPSAFGSAGEHNIILTARDNTDLMSVNPDTNTIDLVKPSFANDILIIDGTDEAQFDRGEARKFDDAEVDSIYASWIKDPATGTVDEWDFKSKGMPSREKLGDYKMVFWHADNYFLSSANAHKIGQHTDVLSEYMNVGGDFIMSGWKILKSLRPREEDLAFRGGNPGFTYPEGSFELEYLHIKKAAVTGATPPGNMVGADGIGEGYSDLEIDSSKIKGYPLSFYSNMTDVDIIMETAGFTSSIYAYTCRPDCGIIELRDQILAVRYFGTSFDAVVFGFPMFFMKEDGAASAVDQILTNMGYREEPAKTYRGR